MANFLFSPTYSYLPAYNQLQYGLTSSNIARSGFTFLTGVKVDGVLISTLSTQTYPNLAYSTVDIHRIAATEISYDLNFNILGATSTPNSIKILNVEVGEEYTGNIKFIDADASGSDTKLELVATPNVIVGDRVQLELDDSLTNSYLNNFWIVTNVVGNDIDIDATYIDPGFTQSGSIKEGVEFYDASFNFNNGTVIIETTNPHRLSNGDTFLLNLDPYAAAYIDITSVTGLSSFDTIEVFRSGITYSLLGTLATGSTPGSLGSAVVLEINSSQNDFDAFDAGSGRLYIYSKRNEGDITVGCSLTISTTGTLSYTQSQFWKSARPAVGTAGLGGWNSFSGIWKVETLLSSTKFTTNIPWQNNTVTGSQRGSIISLSNYKSYPNAETDDRWLMNHTFQYEDFFNYVNPPLFLTEDPRDCVPFSDWTDFQSIDIMTLLGPATSSVASFLMRVTYPLGGTFSDYTYTLQTLKGNKEPRVTFGVGPANIGGLFSTFSATKPETYNVTIYDDFGNIFYNKNFCYKCRNKTYYRIKWLNPLGGWDFYDFNYADRSIEGSKESFYRAIGSVKNNTWIKSNGERGLTVYDNRTFDKFLFYTDLLKRNEAEWLSGLFNSPEVYLLEGSLLKPIVITNEEFVRFGEANKVRQLQFEARLAYNNITQVN